MANVAELSSEDWAEIYYAQPEEFEAQLAIGNDGYKGPALLRAGKRLAHLAQACRDKAQKIRDGFYTGLGEDDSDGWRAQLERCADVLEQRNKPKEAQL